MDGNKLLGNADNIKQLALNVSRTEKVNTFDKGGQFFSHILNHLKEAKYFEIFLIQDGNMRHQE